MFTTSLGLLVSYFASYIFLPLLVWIFATWTISGAALKGLRFYFMSWFIGLWVLSYGLFLTQFFYFGINRVSFFIVCGITILLFVIRTYFTKTSMKKYLACFTIKMPKDMFTGKSWNYIFTVVILALLLVWFIITSGVFVTSFPSYADDSFGNRHLPVVNMLYDWGIKIFGETNEILARSRLWYPIMIPAFKAFVSYILGGFNDIYTNILQWLATLFFLLHAVVFAYEKTRNIRTSLLGACLVISLPIFFLHSVEGYMDLLSAIYAWLAVCYFYEWLSSTENNPSYFLVGFILLAILAYIKNDWFVVYASSVLISLALYLAIFHKKYNQKMKIFTSGKLWIGVLGIVAYFILPFTFIKGYYNLGFNPTTPTEGATGISSTIHTEIFPAIRSHIWSQNNYSIAFIVLLIAIIYVLLNLRKDGNTKTLFLLLCPIATFLLFMLVFLVTENYKYVLDQTTVNRVFTMCFVILFSYFGVLTHEQE